MPFPDSPREVFPRNVLKEVICQLRFPNILRITGEPPFQFQDAIRAEYPHYEQEGPEDILSLPPEVAELASGLSIRIGQADATHKFSTADKMRTISLTSGFFAVSETEYVDRESFREAVIATEREFRAVYSPSFYTRVGVRYRNAVDRTALGITSREWHNLLNPALLAELGADHVRRDVREIVTRSELSVDGEPERRVRIVHGLAKSEQGRQVYVLDADFFATHELGESDDIAQLVAEFSDLNGRFFRWAISPELADVLRGSRDY